jgi:hypothetical protein
MMLKSVTERKSRILLAGVLAVMTQVAWSDDNRQAPEPAVPVPAALLLQLEADAKAYMEALNQRLAEELARDLEAIGAPRVELVIAEVPTRG